jgi:hypothetical protein
MHDMTRLRTLASYVTVIVVPCVVGLGCRPTPSNDEPAVDGKCPYALLIAPVVDGRRVAVDVTVVNKSSADVGWDGEFAAGLHWYVYEVPEELIDKTEPGSINSQKHLIEPERLGRVPDGDRHNQARYVKLRPGAQLTKRVSLTDRFRCQDEEEIEFPPPVGLKARGFESLCRLRLPQGSCAIDVTALFLCGPAFLQSFGIKPSDVSIKDCGGLKSNSLRIRLK